MADSTLAGHKSLRERVSMSFRRRRRRSDQESSVAHVEDNEYNYPPERHPEHPAVHPNGATLRPRTPELAESRRSLTLSQRRTSRETSGSSRSSRTLENTGPSARSSVEPDDALEMQHAHKENPQPIKFKKTLRPGKNISTGSSSDGHLQPRGGEPLELRQVAGLPVLAEAETLSQTKGSSGSTLKSPPSQPKQQRLVHKKRSIDPATAAAANAVLKQASYSTSSYKSKPTVHFLDEDDDGDDDEYQSALEEPESGPPRGHYNNIGLALTADEALQYQSLDDYHLSSRYETTSNPSPDYVYGTDATDLSPQFSKLSMRDYPRTTSVDHATHVRGAVTHEEVKPHVHHINEINRTRSWNYEDHVNIVQPIVDPEPRILPAQHWAQDPETGEIFKIPRELGEELSRDSRYKETVLT